MLKDGQPPPQRGTGLPMVYSNAVSRGHFQTLQIPVIAGRDFVATDRPGAPEVAIVNETLARRLWPNERPIGQRLREWRGNEAPGPWIDVVGLVKDSNYVTVGEAPKPFMYRPLPQVYSPAVSLLVRAHGEPMTALSAVRTAIDGLDSDLPAFGVTTLDAATSISLLPVRTAAVLAMTLGAVALVLVAIGLHGTMSYLVRRRTRELGMRMALGAPPSSLTWMVTLQGLRWTVTGAVLGIVASFAVTRVLTGLLYGIGPSDAVVFLIVPAVLIGTAYIACHAPGRWASRVDPQVALKVD
jgi:putative ABC transport system permease protein